MRTGTPQVPQGGRGPGESHLQMRSGGPQTIGPPSQSMNALGPPGVPTSPNGNGVGSTFTANPPRTYTPEIRPPQVVGAMVSEDEIDTKSGGEAGMAGVGRRGFVAAARAAMFALPARPNGPPSPPPPQTQHPTFAQVLRERQLEEEHRDSTVAVVTPQQTKSPSLPPPWAIRSASPDTSLPRDTKFEDSEMARGLPIPPSKINTNVLNPSLQLPQHDKTPIDDRTPLAGPASPDAGPATPFGVAARPQFFDKLQGIKSMDGNNSLERALTPTQPSPPKDMASATKGASPIPFAASETRALSSSGRSSPTESEYSGGLAYADSDDDYGRSNDDWRGHAAKYSLGGESILSLSSNRPLPSPFGHDHSRSGSATMTSVGRLLFSASPDSIQEEDERNQISFPTSERKRSGSSQSPPYHRRSHSRNDSASSAYSSASSTAGRKRTNSAAIASALGLSQTPPSEYSKLGGPGIHGHGPKPLGRSTSTSSSASRTGSTYSRATSLAIGGENSRMTIGGPANTSAFEALERTLLNQKMEELKNLTGRESNRRSDWSATTTRTAKAAGAAGAESLAKSKSMGSSGGSAYGHVRNRTAGTSVSGSIRGLEYAAPEAEFAAQGLSKRSKTLHGVASPEGQKPVKLPARAKTTVAEDGRHRDTDRARGGTTEALKIKKKEKVCVKCRTCITDGKWIQVDGGAILCERCWKHMYLPKCRRCTTPIERAAVSSSDGQLKGKYHKECFNCATCNKPFPDRTFYVFDGKPYCAYHYHEANDSLCAAARCGQPIEGPCAVSHAGDRYHPQCMTCEWPGAPECRERLEEYYEVEGRMLCEHHATMSDDGEDERWQTSKAMKRTTRFIDLSEGIIPKDGDRKEGEGEEEDSGLR